jgi:hypothetical protein
VKEFDYKPKTMKDGNLLFEGIVKLKVPSYYERLELIKKVNFQSNEKGEVENNKHYIDSLIKLAMLTKDFIKEVDVLRVEDGFKYVSFDDLSFDKDGSLLIEEIGHAVLNGISLGKN